MRALGFRAPKQNGQWHVDVYDENPPGKTFIASINGSWEEVRKILTDIDKEQHEDWDVFEE